MKKSVKAVLLFLVVIIVILLLLIDRLGPGLSVQVREVSPGTVRREVTEEGYVKADVEHTVYSRFRARVDKLKVRDGDRVEAGGLLMTLDRREMDYKIDELQARLEALKGEEMKLTEEPGKAAKTEADLAVAQAQAQYEAARREYERRKKLYHKGTVSQEHYDKTKDLLVDSEYYLARARKKLPILRESYDPPPGSHEVIAAQRQALQAQINLIHHQIEDYAVKSPIAGVVGRLLPEEKELVDPQTPLLTIFQDDLLLIEAKVLARDSLFLEPGMPVRLTLELEDEDVYFPGKIQKIAPQAEEDVSPLGLEERRVKITVEAEFPADYKIGPGHELDVTFTLRKKTDQLAVPKRSLFTVQGNDAVFVVENGRAAVRKVETGLSGNQETAITSGLSPRDLVIVNPRQEGLAEGVRVAPIAQSADQ